MLIKKLSSILLAAAGIALGAGLTSTAQALLFTTSGTTSGGAVSGSADFAITGSALIITLTNTTGSVGTIAQVLDGLTFTLPNSQHNDYLLGPVAFNLSGSFTGLTSVSGVTFLWGTTPETTTGGTTLGCTANCVLIQPAPEPGSLALLGLALSGLAWVRRRVR